MGLLLELSAVWEDWTGLQVARRMRRPAVGRRLLERAAQVRASRVRGARGTDNGERGQHGQAAAGSGADAEDG